MRVFFRPLILFLLVPIQVFANSVGKPFEDLQTQIDELKEALKSKDSPIEVRVHCEYGESVNQAIAEYVYSPRHLWIEVSGNCDEEVTVGRDNVRIRGVDEYSVISPSRSQSEYGAIGISVSSYRNIVIERLEVRGDFAAMAVGKGGNARLDRVELRNSRIGLMCSSGASCTFTDSLAEQNFTGLQAYDGGNIVIEGSRLADNLFGIIAISGGHVFLQANPYLSQNLPSIEGGIFGIYLRGNSTVAVSGINLLNATYGVFADAGSHVDVLGDAEVTFENLVTDLFFTAGARLNILSEIKINKESPTLTCTSLGAITGLISNAQGEQVELPENCSAGVL
jgi:hypothetical protein